MSRVLTLGEAMVLFLAEPGVPLRAAGSFRRSIAGAETNFAVAMARFGNDVGFLGRVGADALGDLVVSTLRGEGVAVDGLLRDPDAPTGVLVRDAVPDRAVEVVYVRGGSAGSRVGIADLPEVAPTVDLVHVTAITPLLSSTAAAAVHGLIDRAQTAGAIVSVDPNLRFSLASRGEVLAAARKLVDRADLVLGAAEELAALGDLSVDDVVGAPARAAPKARLVVAKTGVGAVCESADERVAHEAERVPSIDPVGAGDAFDAGFLDSWLRRRPLDEALATGARAGRAVAMVPTDLDGIPFAASLRRTDDQDVRR